MVEKPTPNPKQTYEDCAKPWGIVDKIENIVIRGAETGAIIGTSTAVLGAGVGAFAGAGAGGVGAVPGAAIGGIVLGGVGAVGGSLLGAEVGLFEALHHNAEAPFRCWQETAVFSPREESSAPLETPSTARPHGGKSRAELKKMEMGAPPPTSSAAEAAHITPPTATKSKPPMP